MKQYIGTKIIQAEPGDKDGQAGYKVLYPDGYLSWSPKQVFEESYKLTSEMTFDQALKAIMLGHKVSMAIWSDEHYLYLKTDLTLFKKAFISETIIRNGTQEDDYWFPHQPFLLTNNWRIINPASITV